VPITTGSQVYFAESIDAVPENLKEVQPTIFFGVPRIWEKFHNGISVKLQEASGVKAKLVKWAMGVGWKTNRAPGAPKGLQYQLANKLIFSKLKPAIGMGRARVCVSGAAPIAREVLEFFAKLDLVVLEVYGQSEDSGPTSFNLPGRYRFGTVGPVLDGVVVKIAEDDEILVRGPNVFLGYFKNPAATDATLVDGWLHSGDLGSIDADGFLHITGRKKDIIITAGGKNVTPSLFENELKFSPYVSDAVVIGDKRKYLTCLVMIDKENVEHYAQTHSIPFTDYRSLCARPEIVELIDGEVRKINKRFSNVEQIKKFRLIDVLLTPEDEELTPTMKLKRSYVSNKYNDLILDMYGGR
jgi:long-chain acyl-CoA synthetase